MERAVPVVDVRELVGGRGDEAGTEAAKRLGEACTGVGFVYVVNHGISEDLVADVIRVVREFYALDTAEKRQIKMSESTHWRGYSELGSEITLKKRDWHECIDFGPETAEAEGNVMAGPNLWPRQPERFRTLLELYYSRMRDLGRDLMVGVAMACGLDPQYFSKAFGATPWCLMRLLYYPEMPTDSEKKAFEAAGGGEIGIGVGEHTDYGCLTILRSDAEGLEVKLRDTDEWIGAPPVKGAFVVNIGDMLARWTCGVFRATPHRVRTVRNRVSIPFFYEPSWDTVVVPLASMRGHPLAKKDISDEPVHYGKYLESKYAASYHPAVEAAGGKRREGEEDKGK